VIHVDEARRNRVDLYTWRKMYSEADARALVKRIAQSVQITPKLAELLDGAKGFEAREEARFEKSVDDALAALSKCGIRSMGPGMVAVSDRCASWFSDDRRLLNIARPLGIIPLAAATGRWQDAPEYKWTIPDGRSQKLIGPTDFRLAMMFWDDRFKRWDVAGFGEHRHDDDDREFPLIKAITPRLHDRTSVHVFAMASYDLKFWPERVAIDEFFEEAERVRVALAAGKVVAGLRAEPFGLDKP
jgi:hypothetical protein